MLKKFADRWSGFWSEVYWNVDQHLDYGTRQLARGDWYRRPFFTIAYCLDIAKETIIDSIANAIEKLVKWVRKPKLI